MFKIVKLDGISKWMKAKTKAMKRMPFNFNRVLGNLKTNFNMC